MVKKDQRSDYFLEVIKRYARHPMFAHLNDITANSTAMDGDSILHKAVSSKDADAVRVLLDHGANPNIVGDMGCTPLHEAVELQQIEIASVLLEAGASPLALSEFKQSPFDIASQQLDRQMVNLLRKYL